MADRLLGDNLPELFDLIGFYRGLTFQQESSAGPLKQYVFPITHVGQVCNGRSQRMLRIGHIGPRSGPGIKPIGSTDAKQIDCRRGQVRKVLSEYYATPRCRV